MAAGCEGGSWDKIENTWGFPRYQKMMEVWKEHGPPSFISLAVMNGHKPKSGKKSTSDEKPGTMADLAAMFGLGKKKKAIF